VTKGGRQTWSKQGRGGGGEHLQPLARTARRASRCRAPGLLGCCCPACQAHRRDPRLWGERCPPLPRAAWGSCTGRTGDFALGCLGGSHPGMLRGVPPWDAWGGPTLGCNDCLGGPSSGCLGGSLLGMLGGCSILGCSRRSLLGMFRGVPPWDVMLGGVSPWDAPGSPSLGCSGRCHPGMRCLGGVPPQDARGDPYLGCSGGSHPGM